MGKEKYVVPLVFLCFAATLAPWFYDFPLNDDWAYALAARALAETGRLTLSDWGSATQLPHILTGALTVKLFGFSFSALRLANLLVAAGALFVFVKILDQLKLGRFEKLAAGLALALNPLYLLLANSFMTDIHYFFWMLSAVYFYIKRLNDPGDAAALGWAGACCAAAYLTRQLALALPLAFTLVLLLRGRRSWRELAAVWAPPAAAAAGYYLWFTRVHGPTWASENYVAAATLGHLSKPLVFLNASFYRLFASLAETGLFLLPLGIGYLFALRRAAPAGAPRRALHPAGICLALIAMGLFALLNGQLPYLENSLASSGLGVLTLSGAAMKPSGLFASQAFWTLATAGALLSSVFLLCCSGLVLRSGDGALRFFFAACALQLGVSLLGAKFFDRYLLSLLPWFAAAAGLAAKEIKFSRPAAAAALLACAAFSWAGMKDYLAWNAAKWELASRQSARLAPGEIVNGFDFEAWHNYQKNMERLKAMKPLKLIGEWEWQKVNRYNAVISFTTDQRFKVIDKAEYATPLSAKKGVLYLSSLKP